MTLTEFLDQLQALVDRAADLPAHEVMVALEDQFISKQGDVMRAELSGSAGGDIETGGQ